MNKIKLLLAGYGISPAFAGTILVFAILALIGLSTIFCGKKKTIIPPVDEKAVQELQSQNTAVREAKADAVIDAVNEKSKADDARIAISDEKRREIKRELEQSVLRGRNVTAEDFRKLIQESQE